MQISRIMINKRGIIGMCRRRTIISSSGNEDHFVLILCETLPTSRQVRGTLCDPLPELSFRQAGLCNDYW